MGKIHIKRHFSKHTLYQKNNWHLYFFQSFTQGQMSKLFFETKTTKICAVDVEKFQSENWQFPIWMCIKNIIMRHIACQCSIWQSCGIPLNYAHWLTWYIYYINWSSLSVCMNVYIYVCMYICMYVYMYIHARSLSTHYSRMPWPIELKFSPYTRIFPRKVLNV